MIFKYTAPKLTKYGKVTEFIQAGSVAIATGDVTGDGVSDTLFDTDGDGLGDLVVGGANQGQTPVTLAGFGSALYDGDGDGLPGIFAANGAITRINNPFNVPFIATETAEEDGWDDPARD